MNEDTNNQILVKMECPACKEMVEFDLTDRSAGDYTECEECFTSLEIKSVPEFFPVTNLGK